MVRYWFSFTPLVVVLTVVFLALPWLGLIALMLLALTLLAALGALAWGIALLLHMVVRVVSPRRHVPMGMTRQPATLPAVRPSGRPTQSIPAGATVFLASSPPDSERLT